MSNPSKLTRILTASGPEGEEISVPVASAHGSADGPTLAVVAGVHGSEYDGIEAVKQLFAWIDCERLRGTVRMVPCLNIPAFYGLAMHVNPVDGQNPARCFPGNAAGTYTERMVDLLWRDVVSDADAVIDVHGGDLEEELVSYSQINLSGNRSVDQKAEGIALALDMPFFVRRAAPAEPVRVDGTLCQVAASNGIAAALAEAGSHGLLDPGCVQEHLKGLRNVLTYLRMIDHPPTVEHEHPVLLHRFVGVVAPVSGMWYPSVTKGARVEKGQTLGVVRDFFGKELALVVSEENAVVLGVITVLARQANEMVMGLGTLE
jgi:predicted deacylase